LRSTATIVVAPVIVAAMIAARPTVPVPNTATAAPAGGRSALRIAPAPVWTPQPNGAMSSKAMSSSSLTTLRSVAMQWVAKQDWPKKCEWTGSPSRESAVVPSGRVAAKLNSKKPRQYEGRPVRHDTQVPHDPKLIAT
jgi:hypothetical protein